MTVCNMTIEGGGRAGMIAPDDTTFEWVEGREAAPDRAAARRVARAPHRRRRRASTRRSWSTPRRSRRRSPGARRRGWSSDVTGAVPEPQRRGRRARARVHGARARHADPGDPRSTASSSAPAPTRASATCARPPRSCEGRKVAAGRRRDGRAGLPAGEGRRPRPRASTRSSAPPASTGARPAARCAWA